MGRRPLSKEEKKSKSQIAKDYRERNAGKIKDYELIRQEKRKLERLLKKKAAIITKEDVDTQSPLSEHNNLEIKTKKTSEEKLTQDEEVFSKLGCRKEETFMMNNIFRRSRTGFLHDIIESMDGALDIQVVCCDESFMWSRLLLSLISPHMNHILNQAEQSDAFIVDIGVEANVVQEALINLLKVEPEWKEDYRDIYELFHIPGVIYELDPEQKVDAKETIKSDVVKVGVLDECVQAFYSTDDNVETVEKPENNFDEITQKERMANSTLNQREYVSNKVKKKTLKREKVWTKDPSPERFMGGKKVKWICVTQKNVSSGPPYYCISCSYKSNVLDNVKKHYRIHTGEKLFGCKVCAKKFISSTAATSHWNNRHNKDRLKDFSCDICGLLFSSRGILLRHKVVHSGEIFSCGSCTRDFNTPWKRDSHEKIHFQKPIPCPICGKEFSSKINAENHEKRHGELREHSCEICGKGFKTKRDVRIHQNIVHSDVDMSCACTECGRNFKRQNLLKVHVKRVHERSTQFQCPICPKILSTKHHFNKHSLRCHNGQLIPVSNRVR